MRPSTTETGDPGAAPAVAAGDSGPAVLAARVSRTYPARRKHAAVEALDRIELSLGPGQIVAVIGPSGCGKSTLLDLVGGLQAPDAGAVAIDGATGERERLAVCAHMPQSDLLLPWRDAASNAALALEWAGERRATARHKAEPLLERLGLGGFERALPRELSGGMRRRVAFARTLLTGRAVLLLDEPFAGLDAITRAAAQEWLAAVLESERRTVLCATHDIDEALFLADRVAVLSPRPGRVIAELVVEMPRPRPRRETVTDPWFTDLKQQALEALAA